MSFIKECDQKLETTYISYSKISFSDGHSDIWAVYHGQKYL